MPRSERGARYQASEDGDGDACVAVNVNASRPSRKPMTRSPKAGTGALDDGLGDFGTEWLPSPAKASALPRPLAALFPRSSWLAQAFQHSLTEGGMALITAFILLLLSLAGFLTMYLLAPSLTSSVLRELNVMASASGEEEVRESVTNIVPEALTLLQVGLQVMVIPAMAVGFAGVFVLGSADRRRPGCALVSYCASAVVLGLALLYLLLRLAIGGGLSGLEESMNATLYGVWNTTKGDSEPCDWERAFSCSGFHYCCVTNTSALADEAEGLENSAAWESLCFVTLPDGSAVTQDRENVTAVVAAQCGVMRPGRNDVGPITACSTAASASKKTAITARLVTCEDYVLGHLTSSVGFALQLLLGMTVCSLVSGMVATLSYFQRSRTADFMLVNNPAAAAVGESPMTGRERK